MIRRMIKIVERAAPNGQSRAFKNCSVIRLPINMLLAPPRRSGMTNSPRQGTKTKVSPLAIAMRVLGMSTRVSTFHSEAPRSLAASTRVKSNFPGRINREHHEGKISGDHTIKHEDFILGEEEGSNSILQVCSMLWTGPSMPKKFSGHRRG